MPGIYIKSWGTQKCLAIYERIKRIILLKLKNISQVIERVSDVDRTEITFGYLINFNYLKVIIH